MPHPGSCGKPVCRLCYLMQTDDRYRALWGSPGMLLLVKPAARTGPCLHLGEQVGLRDCPTCKGTVKQKTFACGAGHGEIVLRDCQRCGDFEERP